MVEEINLDSICRLCLSVEEDTHNMYDVNSDRIITKVATCLGLDLNEDLGQAMPSRICLACRLDLEKSFVFRMNATKADRMLRKWTINPLDVQLVSLRSKNEDLKRPRYDEQDEQEEIQAIEQTVRMTLEKQNYFGEIQLEIRRMDDDEMREVRATKDNGAMLIMRIRMPQKPPPDVVDLGYVTHRLDNLSAVVGRIETKQQETVTLAEEARQKCLSGKRKAMSQLVPSERQEEGDDFDSDEEAFSFPIRSLSKLWQYDAALARPSFRQDMVTRWSKLQISIKNTEHRKGTGRLAVMLMKRMIWPRMIGTQLYWSKKLSDLTKQEPRDPLTVVQNLQNVIDLVLTLVKNQAPEFTWHEFSTSMSNMIRRCRGRYSPENKQIVGHDQPEEDTDSDGDVLTGSEEPNKIENA